MIRLCFGSQRNVVAIELYRGTKTHGKKINLYQEYYDNMASPIESLLYVADLYFFETSIRWFAALGKTKKLRNKKINGYENKITDFFFLTVTSKIFLMLYLTEL